MAPTVLCSAEHSLVKTKWPWRAKRVTIFIYSPVFRNSNVPIIMIILWSWSVKWRRWQMFQRDYACHVEATEVQVHILAGDFVRFHTNDSFCCCRLLGFWWWTSQSFQCLLSPPQKWISWCCCNPHAHSPGKQIPVFSIQESYS